MTDHIPDAGKKVDHPEHNLEMVRAARSIWGESAILPFAGLERFWAIAYRQGMERAAEIAADYCRTYNQTKEAHERLSTEPFRPERFGFDLHKLHQSRRIADNIRAEAHAQNIDMTQPSCRKTEGN